MHVRDDGVPFSAGERIGDKARKDKEKESWRHGEPSNAVAIDTANLHTAMVRKLGKDLWEGEDDKRRRIQVVFTRKGDFGRDGQNQRLTWINQSSQTAVWRRTSPIEPSVQAEGMVIGGQ